MDSLQRWLTLLVLISAALAALLYLSRMVWRGFQLVEQVGDLLQHELTHNSGSSMKDDLAAIAVAVGRLQLAVADLNSSKETAHTVLQIQLDSIVDELGLEPQSHRHRRNPS